MDIPADFRRYISSLLSGPHTPPRADGIEPISSSQWQELFSRLTPHEIIPLLYLRTASLPREFRPPDAVMAAMRESFLRSRIRAMQMERQLSGIVRAFDAAHVELIILKGIALGWSHYPDPAARPAADLDILVKPADMDRAHPALEGLGYHTLSRRFDGVYKDVGCEELYLHDDAAYRLVELHWDLFMFHSNVRDAGIVIEDLFDRAVVVKTPAFSFRALHPVDALVHAAMHLIGKHGDEKRLGWVYDIALIAGRLSVPDDWTALQKRCVQWGGRSAVESALKLAKQWTGLTIPPGFDDLSSWPEAAAVENGSGSKGRQGDGWLRELFRTNRLNQSAGRLEKAHFWLRLAFPSREYMMMYYPPRRGWLLPLSYGRRWFKWLGRL